MKLEISKLISPPFSGSLNEIVESLGITFCICNTFFSLKGNTLSIQSLNKKNTTFVNCFLYAWNFFAKTNINLGTFYTSGKLKTLEYRFESKKKGRSSNLEIHMLNAEKKEIKLILLDIIELSYKCFKDETLRHILEMYTDEVFNNNKPLYGVYKIVEVFIQKYKGINNLAQINKMPESYIKDIKSSSQHQRHVYSLAPKRLSQKECLKRINNITNVYITSLKLDINLADFNRPLNEADNFIEKFHTLSLSERYLLFLFCINNPISRYDFFEQLDYLRINVHEIKEDNYYQLRSLKNLLKNFLEIRSRDEEYIMVLKQKYIQEILVYFLSKDEELIQKFIESSIFFNQLSIFSTKREKEKIKVSERLASLIEEKVLKDFQEFYGSDIEVFNDGSYGTKEKDRVSKLFKFSELFNLKSHPKIVAKLESEIKKMYLDRIFFSDEHYIDLIKNASTVIKLDGKSLLENYLKEMRTLDDIVNFIELTDRYKADYKNILKLKRKDITKRVLQIVDNELKILKERLNDSKNIRNLFGQPTSHYIAHLQGQITDVALFFRINLYDHIDNLEDEWDNLFFSELENKQNNETV